MENAMNEQSLLESVKNQYAAVARSGLSNDSEAVRAVALAFGYSAEDLADLPPQANMGLSCGNPIALAGLRPGETVVDLGCGGGLDVLLAAKRVGPTGRAIGIDMTPEMIQRARDGAVKVGVTNVDFHLAEIDDLPLADATVDCIISNCVVNLVPDKLLAFREMLRVLKPGGRVALSDIALRKPLPPAVAADVQAYVGCISGALLIADYERLLREAGFAAVVVSETGADLNAYSDAGSGGCCTSELGGCCTVSQADDDAPSFHDGLTKVLQSFDANDYAAGVRVHAIKLPVHGTTMQDQGDRPMKYVQVFDKPMCCSTGVCGPDVDPVLPRFAADLEWLKSQQPTAFTENKEVLPLVASHGTDCLPLVLVDGSVVSRGEYPTREQLAAWVAGVVAPNVASLNVVDPQAGGSCCGPKGCC